MNYEDGLIELNEGSPYGLTTTSGKERSNEDSLICLLSYDQIDNLLCRCQKEPLIKLKQKYTFTHGNEMKEFYDKLPKTISDIYDSENLPLKIKRSLKFPCCDCDFEFAKMKKLIFPTIKFFIEKNRLMIFSDLKDVKKLPKTILMELGSQLEDCYKNRTSGVCHIPSNTLNFPILKLPDGFEFGLQLKDYQLRNMSWMLEMESKNISRHNTMIYRDFKKNYDDSLPSFKVRFGNSDLFIGLNDSSCTFYTSPETSKATEIKVNASLFADYPGTGRSVTVIALIALEYQQRQKQREKMTLFYCDATLIVCKTSIDRWEEQVKKLQPHLKILKLVDMESVSIDNIKKADVVLMTKEVLRDLSRGIETEQFDLFTLGYENEFGSEEYYEIMNFKQIKFHRIVYDQLSDENDYFYDLYGTETPTHLLNLLDADFIWGIAEDLIRIDHRWVKPFLKKFIRDKNGKGPYLKNQIFQKFLVRNEIVFEEDNAKIIEQVVGIELLPIEKISFQSAPRGTFGKSMMNRLFYHVAKYYEDALKNYNTLKSEHLKRSKKIYAKLISAQPKIKVIKRLKAIKYEIDHSVDDESDVGRADFTKKRAKQLKIDSKIQNLRSRYNFMQSTFHDLRFGRTNNDEKDAMVITSSMSNTAATTTETSTKCTICYDMITEDNFSILSCCHCFCYDCISQYMNNYSRCPLCFKDSMKITRLIFGDSQEELEKESGVKLVNYGSKLIRIHLFIKNLLETNESARVVIYFQFRALKYHLHKKFTTLNYNLLTLYDRAETEAATKEFNDPNQMEKRIILMCGADDLSGISLTGATHLLILHPFTQVEKEICGMRKIHRLGLTHPLTVVRFFVKDTDEELIFAKNKEMWRKLEYGSTE